MKFSLCWYWRNCWVGVRYSDNRHALYFNLVPFLSFRITLRRKQVSMESADFHEMPTPKIAHISEITDYLDAGDDGYRG